ncbi:MAG TPA: ribonuclease III [Candidatus Peribacter riflensis]|uniref:Ribonuclease 3 n=1 Tax=Candidatus Peribacter riflensis TaxID=1735162 RepID=A0A0S1SK89_9BACT|nr:MAG: putative ribonuclease III [Candidatus Peribacter riflensis]OGJ81992.1 MAG: ribonuclease III [Candidatus Peribacteria bacterium RIFOXYC1_FULL_58_8]ALM10725.1 MAG: putative ribonuclease III [Candidatus Peribacter riflensis]ALM11827.1 MAG: putative ribonuclease III [Candidatus Peribacter riflensis]ALM12930.1 MAG: putative ribonuclease III [Candidatus Peribacter riflensis]
MPPQPLSLLEKSLHLSFKDKDLLAQSLTHRSATGKARLKKHNERMEFLGDAVLELVATEHLFSFENKSEGELTNWRAALVNGKQLAVVARELKLGDYLFMSRGEEASGGRDKESTLANALEALIGAIYLDQGFDAAREFCFAHILMRLDELLKAGKHRDFKSVFQEKAQELLGVTPHYDVVAESGPDHDKEFTCAVFVGSDRVAQGSGASKQEAEQAAAQAGLNVKKWK